MKRIFALMMAVVMVFALCACGGAKEEKAPAETAAEAEKVVFKQGFDLEMLDAVCNAVSVPVIASGGAGCIDDFLKLFHALPKVDAGLAASIFHFGEVKITDLKQAMAQDGISTRL